MHTGITASFSYGKDLMIITLHILYMKTYIVWLLHTVHVDALMAYFKASLLMISQL